MASKISKGVKITVKTYHQLGSSGSSNPGEYLFFYQITIKNHNAFSVKICDQNWHIIDPITGHKSQFDSVPTFKLLPVLEQDDWCSFSKGCILPSEMGKIEGVYVVKNINNKECFEVQVPPFDFMAQFKNN
jgi:ApaG protein